MKILSLVLRTAAAFLLVLPLAIQARADADRLSPLRILFVGYDPRNPQLNDYEQQADNPEQLIALKRTRSMHFEHLLRRYFTTVKVVYGPAYKESLSANYDVTIFDALPPSKNNVDFKIVELRPMVIGGGSQKAYLSQEFDRAAVLLGPVAAQISVPLQYKMDWQCLCLEAHAHDLALSHPIFNTPYKVTPTLVERPTPQSYRLYFSGRALGSTIPMWRVQKRSSSEDKGFPAGLVSSGPGFAEANDAEVISGGECSKGRNSVSIARQGNFFMWGFSGDAEDMTDEAQRVFVNAIHYIARFNGQRPYSHRPYGSLTREVALDAAYRQQGETYDAWKTNQDAQFTYMLRLWKAGLSKYEPQRVTKDHDQWVKDELLSWYPDTVVASLGTDIQKYLPYYESNVEYLRPGSKPYEFEVDEDVRSLAVSNRSVALLDLCVAMLESNTDTDKARRILVRYTGQNFDSASEWRQWLTANRARLYFSDVDGFRFHVSPPMADQVLSR